jgi:uncharacterized membrane protein
MVLALKLFLVPSLIWGVTIAGRRWGPAFGGWLSAFPLISAPILFFVALQQGTQFAADAAVGTLAAVPANVAFGLAYAWTATRHGWLVSLIAGLAAWFALVACLNLWAPGFPLVVGLVAAVLLVAPRLYPPLDAEGAASTHASDILWRMVAGAALVLAVTHFSGTLGARLSGALAMFPVMGSVLAVFSHRHSGAAFTIHLLRGMVLGFFSFASFCIVLALTLPALGIAPAFLLSLGCAVLVHACTRVLLRRSRHRGSA